MKNLTEVQLHAMAFHIKKLEHNLYEARKLFLIESDWVLGEDDLWRKGCVDLLTDGEAFYNELRERGWNYD